MTLSTGAQVLPPADGRPERHRAALRRHRPRRGRSATIVAIVGKTEGNGCVNDFSRG